MPHRKGSLLTTLSDLVTERMENLGETAQRQPDALSNCQEATACLSEPVLPVRDEIITREIYLVKYVITKPRFRHSEMF